MMMRFFFLIYLALVFLPHSLWATQRCEEALKKYRAGAQFLHQRNPELHNLAFVNQLTRRIGFPKINPSSSPIDKLSVWLEYIESTHFKHLSDQDMAPETVETSLSKIKKYYFNRYIIKPHDVPESYFERQKRIARERGDGDNAISDSARKQMITNIIAEQKFSLETWLDYFLSEETSMYPLWAKYWSFTGLVKLGSFDKEKGRFTKRTSSTVAPFPELNREALAYIMDAIIKKNNKESLESIEDPIFLKVLEGADFGSLYTQAFKHTTGQTHQLTMVNGEWVKYTKGSDHRPLFESLQGKNTGWCTAGESTARTHLNGGDFYVYYSYDQKGLATNPRIAIRMQGSRIAEVRGIGVDQHLDSEIAKTEILSEKMKEFGSKGEHYQKAAQHMKRLTALEARHLKGEALGVNDLHFLYEIDEPILSLGIGKDPRIQDLIPKGNLKHHLSLAIGIEPKKISTEQSEALAGNIVYHHGDLDLWSLKSAKGLTLPRTVRGNVDLSGLRSAEGLTLPQTVGGHLNLRGLQSAEGLTLPQTVGGDLNLRGLQSAEGLTLPQTVGGHLALNGLRSAEGLTLPQTVGTYLNLKSLQSASGLTLPQTVGGYLVLWSLQSASGLTLPRTVGGDLLLNGLQSAKGLNLPHTVGGDLLLNGLQSAEGLILPQTLGGNVYLGN